MRSTDRAAAETAATHELVASGSEMVRVRSSALGEIEVPRSEMLTAAEPLRGFPGSTRYAVVPHARSGGEADDRVAWLQALEPPFHALPIAHALHAPRGYAPRLSTADLVGLELGATGDANIWLVMSVPEEGPPRVNLRAPIFVNGAAGRMKQVVLVEDHYPTRYPLTL